MLLSEMEEITEQLTCYHTDEENIRGFCSETLRSVLKMLPQVNSSEVCVKVWNQVSAPRHGFWYRLERFSVGDCSFKSSVERSYRRVAVWTEMSRRGKRSKSSISGSHTCLFGIFQGFLSHVVLFQSPVDLLQQLHHLCMLAANQYAIKYFHFSDWTVGSAGSDFAELHWVRVFIVYMFFFFFFLGCTDYIISRLECETQNNDQQSISQ